LAPLGCKAIVHNRAIGCGGKQQSWKNRGLEGYYIGPVMTGYWVWRLDTGYDGFICLIQKQ